MLLINGQWREGAGTQFDSHNPADDSVVWQGQSASPADVDAAFTAARNAFSAWGRAPLAERIAVVERYKAELETRKADMAELISQETGKPRWEGLAEAGAMIG